jgi:hypothetical protein
LRERGADAGREPESDARQYLWRDAHGASPS